MGQRLQLHQILKGLGAEKVYFQPPANVTMVYPCIVYQRDFEETTHADNLLYSHSKRYQVTVIDSNPDSEIPDEVAALPMSSFQRFFVVDNLNHNIYNVYF